MEITSISHVSGRFRFPFRPPGVEDYGVWESFTWDNQGREQHALRLIPERAPWHALFAALDEAGRHLPAEPVSATDEADAIIAACWRYGSYANVWTSGEPYPPFRRDPNLTRFGDSEMRRVNLEFASGLAVWWQARKADPALVNRRTRAALAVLPMPWRTRRGAFEETITFLVTDLLRRELAEFALGKAKTNGVADGLALRREANYVTVSCYRNGPVEDYHAGRWSQGSEVPGYLRLYANEVRRIAEEASKRLALHLALRDQLDMEAFRSQLERDFFFPRDWSVTEETAEVEYLGLPGLGSLEPRRQKLAILAPIIYGRSRE